MAYLSNPNQRVMVQQPMRNQRQNQPVVMQTKQQNVVHLQSTVQQQSIPHQVKVSSDCNLLLNFDNFKTKLRSKIIDRSEHFGTGIIYEARAGSS